MNFDYVSYISTSGITTLHTQDIFLEKIKNHANNLIGDHMRQIFTILTFVRCLWGVSYHRVMQWALRITKKRYKLNSIQKTLLGGDAYAQRQI